MDEIIEMQVMDYPSSMIEEDKTLLEEPAMVAISDEECCICLETIEKENMVHLVSMESSKICMHTFHKFCMSLVPKKLCPLCGQTFHDYRLSYPPEETSVFRFIVKPHVPIQNIDGIVASTARMRQRLFSPQNRSSQIIHNNENRRSHTRRRQVFVPLSSPTSSSLIIPFDVLRRDPPAEVNKQSMETHLSDEEFLLVFKMERRTFNSLSKGQKITLRKRNGLFVPSTRR